MNNHRLRPLLAGLMAFTLLLGCGGKKAAEEEISVIAEPPVSTPDPRAVNLAPELIKEDSVIEAILSSMSLEEKIEQMLMPSIQSWTDAYGNYAPFTEMNEEAEELLKRHSFGGIILFRSNLETTPQTCSLIRAIEDTAGKTGILVGVDQEGGTITRLPMGTNGPGNMALMASGNSELVYEQASMIAEELSTLGFNLNFAPDLDINTNPANPIIGVRSFSDDPWLASQGGIAYVHGMNQSAVISCGKHFPGHGDTATDSHTGLPVVWRSIEEIRGEELVPFREAVLEGLPMIMTAHIQFPLIESETYVSRYDGMEVSLPATLSHTIVTGILREEIGFDGVVCTDSMQMGAIADHFYDLDAAMLAINAGVDLLLMPFNLDGAESEYEIAYYVNGIAGMVENGQIQSERIDESCRRILTMKNKYGMLENNLHRDIDLSVPGSVAHHKEEREIAAQCTTVLENRNGLLPLNGGETKMYLLAAASDEQLNGMVFGFERLRKEGLIAEDADYYAVNYNYGDTPYDLYNLIPYTDTVILCSDNYSGYDLHAGYSGNIACVEYTVELCEELGVPVIAVSANLPYDTAVLSDADALLAVYGNKGMLLDYDGQPINDYGPNIPSALDIIFGKYGASGKLPLNIPQFDGYWFTDEIRYEKGYGLTW